MFATILIFAQNNSTDGGGGMPPLMGLLPFVIIFVLFYLLLILPQQRKERKHRETVLNALKKGDKVLTNAGIIGVVSTIKDDEVTLKLEEGKLRVLKGTISRIYGPEEAAKDQKQEVSK
jgi:preprotein translocase subunit YajC